MAVSNKSRGQPQPRLRASRQPQPQSHTGTGVELIPEEFRWKIPHSSLLYSPGSTVAAVSSVTLAVSPAPWERFVPTTR